jgi:hypothetical protein
LLCSQSMPLSGNDAKQAEIQKKAGAIWVVKHLKVLMLDPLTCKLYVSEERCGLHEHM